MKARTRLIGLMGMMLAASGSGEEFRVVRGEVIPRYSRDWTILRECLEVTSTSGRNIFCRTFTERTVTSAAGGVGNARLMPVYRQERTYSETFALTNYPGGLSLKAGDVIRGPVAAMRVGTVKWVGAVHSISTYSSGGSSTYGQGGICDLYDYGVPYTPPERALSPEEARAARAAAEKKNREATIAVVKFHGEKAEAGDATSQYRLGQLYLEGKGVEGDTNKARAWFEKAAEQGHEEARRELRRMAGSQ